MQVIHKLKMDLLRQNNTQIIDAVQLDSNTRKLELSLYEGAMPWAVPDGVLVAIAYMCDDGTRGVYDTLPDDSTAYEIDGNKITITIIPDALAVVGETKMTIIVSSSESKEDSLATFPVTFRVAENYSVDAKDPEGYVNLRGWLESEIDKILGAQVVVDIGWIETSQNVLINTTAKTITIGSGAVLTVGHKKYDIGDIVFDISDFSSGAFVYFDPVSRKLFRKYESGMVYIGALWTPFYMQDLRVDKNRVLVDGMPVSFSSRFLGKTVNVLGDSMTEGVGLTGDDKPYHYWLKQLCGFETVNNYGVGGSCISPKTDEVVEWDTVESFYERYSVMADGADAVVVFGSVNDWVYGHELGTISDTGTDTFYGTMKALCEGLREKYPAADLYFFGSPQNDYVHRRANTLTGEWAENNEGYNRKGYKLQDYNSAMSDVCAIYGIPFCDMSEGLWWGLSGVLGIYRGNDDGTSIPGILGIDSLHPNAEGHKKMALKMAGFINGGGVSSSGICSGNSTGGSDGDGYILPVATPNRLGGVKPVAKTEDMTEPVGVDENGGLWGKAGGEEIVELVNFISEEDVTTISLQFTNADIRYKEYVMDICVIGTSENAKELDVLIGIDNLGMAWVRGACRNVDGRRNFVSGRIYTAPYSHGILDSVWTNQDRITTHTVTVRAYTAFYGEANDGIPNKIVVQPQNQLGTMAAGTFIKVWGVK